MPRQVKKGRRQLKDESESEREDPSEDPSEDLNENQNEDQGDEPPVKRMAKMNLGAVSVSEDRRKWTRSILRVTNKAAELDLSNPYLPQPDLQQSTGTAYFISKHVLVTCYHVIANTQQLLLECDEGAGCTSSVKARVLFMCPNIDLALLYHPKMEGKPLVVASEDTVQEGDTIFGRGFSLGTTRLHTNKGVVSRYEDHLLVVDTPQNPGNSGGPQFTEKDVVVSTCSAGDFFANNISYGVPSLYTRQAVSEYLTARNGKRKSEPVRLEHNWRAFSTKQLDDAAAQHAKSNDPPVLVLRPSEDFRMQRGNAMILESRDLQPDKRAGVLVTKLVERGPSQAAGLKRGDLVTRINGLSLNQEGHVLDHPVKGQSAKVKTYFLSLRPGEPVDLEVVSKGTRKPRVVRSRATNARDKGVSVVFPEVDRLDYEVFAGLVFENLCLNHQHLDMRRTIEFDNALQFENLNTPRLIVSNVLPDSFFECKKTVRKGALVTGVNDTAVNSLDDLRAVLAELIEDDDEEFFMFELASGEEAVIHKATVVAQDPKMRQRRGFPESALMQALAARVADWEYEVDDDCANAED
jgi:S1-C subfamily serine protease